MSKVNQDPYAVLGVTTESSVEDIRKAYRQMALKYHPDRNPDDKEAAVKFKQVAEAFDILGNPEKKSAHDFGIANPHANPHIRPSWAHVYWPPGIEDIFNTVTRQAPRQAPSTNQNVYGPGTDTSINLIITLREAASGCQKQIQVRSPIADSPCTNCTGTGSQPGTFRAPCLACMGRGKVPDSRVLRLKICEACGGLGARPIMPCIICGGKGKIPKQRDIVVNMPAGVDNGHRLRLAGLGSPGAPPGDLFINVVVSPDPRFERKGQDLYTTLNIPLADAVRGAQITTKDLMGDSVLVDILAGAQQGQNVILKGHGITGVLSKLKGDLHVRLQIDIPKAMSPRAVILLNELAQELSR